MGEFKGFKVSQNGEYKGSIEKYDVNCFLEQYYEGVLRFAICP